MSMPPIWWTPGKGGGLWVRSLHGGFKKVASNYGYAWSSDGADGRRDTLPTDAVQLHEPELNGGDQHAR